MAGKGWSVGKAGTPPTRKKNGRKSRARLIIYPKYFCKKPSQGIAIAHTHPLCLQQRQSENGVVLLEKIIYNK